MDEFEKQIKRKFSKNSLRQWLRVMHSNQIWYDDTDDESTRTDELTRPIVVATGHHYAPLPHNDSGRISAAVDLQRAELTRVQIKFDKAAVSNRGAPVFTVNNMNNEATAPKHVIDYDAHTRAEGDSETARHWGWLSERPSIEDYDQMERLARGQRYAVNYDSISADIADQTWQWLLED